MPYNINSKTYALMNDKHGTKIIEQKRIFNVKEPLNSIIASNCCKYGSSLEGRQTGSSFLLGTNYKPPIILDEIKNIILIPTHSLRNKGCVWLILNNILKYYPNNKKSTIIEFHNNTKITLNISYAVFDKQVLKATRLESILRGRNKQKYL